MGAAVVVVETFAAMEGWVTFFATNLAKDAGLKVVAMYTTATVAVVVVAAAAPIPTARATRVAPSTAVAPSGGVGREMMTATGVDLLALFVADELRVELRYSDGLDYVGNNSYNGFKFLTETREDVGDEVLVIQLLARRCDVVGEALHLGVRFSDGRCSLGRRSKRHSSGDDLGAGLQGMLGVDRRPELGCSGRGRYLCEDLLGQGQKQVAGNLLVLDHPLLMGGIGHGIALLAGRLVDGAIDERWRWGGADLDEIPELRTLDGGGDLCVPHAVVGTGQLLRDGRKGSQRPEQQQRMSRRPWGSVPLGTKKARYHIGN